MRQIFVLLFLGCFFFPVLANGNESEVFDTQLNASIVLVYELPEVFIPPKLRHNLKKVITGHLQRLQVKGVVNVSIEEHIISVNTLLLNPITKS